MSHGDRVDDPPPGFEIAAVTSGNVTAAMCDPQRRLYGVQFHPEVRHTPQGREILAHFLYRVCGCKGDWTPASFVEEQVAAIRQAVGEQRVVGALSGGVDSSVAAALVHRAVGDQLTCIFVDHGLLRKNEREEVEAAFRESLGMKIITVVTPERFLNKLQGIVDPEQKRRIIGNEFVRVFEEEASRLGEAGFLLQGTLYPDVIESGAGTAAVIKTHHNVGGIPADLKLKLLEPLRWLFKDEVRQVGLELGLPEGIVWRQPFPRAWPGGQGAGRDHRREAGHGAGGRLDPAPGGGGGGPGAQHLAVLCGAAPGAQRRGDGGRPHLCAPDRDPGGHQRGRHDRRLGAPALRPAGADLQPDRE